MDERVHYSRQRRRSSERSSVEVRLHSTPTTTMPVILVVDPREGRQVDDYPYDQLVDAEFALEDIEDALDASEHRDLTRATLIPSQ